MNTLSLEIKLQEFREKVPDFKHFNEFEDNLIEWVRNKSNKKIGSAVQAVQAAIDASEAQHSEVKEVRHAAKKILTSLNHDTAQFVKCAAKFCDALAVAEPANRKDLSNSRIKLSYGYYLLPPRDLKHLHELGKDIFDNCLSSRKTSRSYFQDVKSGNDEIHILYDPKDNPVALINIDVCDRKVTDFDVANVNESENSDTDMQARHCRREREVAIPHRVLIDVMKKLDCSDDNDPDMVRFGALTRFRDGVPHADPIRLHDGRRLYLYSYANEIITVFDFDVEHEDDGDKKQISRFYLDEGNCYPSWEDASGNALEVGELLWLMQRNPELREKLSSLR